jgi:hypothetical protein
MQSLKGRPLWLNQTQKSVPPPDSYDIKSPFGSKQTILKSRATHFVSMNPGSNQTAATQSAITSQKHKLVPLPSEGIASYQIKMDQVKKRQPAYSQSLSKQNALFDHSKFIILL